MRRLVLVGLPVLFLLLAGAALWYRFTWHGDALQAARLRIAHGDMQGAELYLRQAIREHPNDGEPAFRLGQVDLALGNAGGAELELRRARARGYDEQAILRPLGQAMLEQQHWDQLLHEFDPAAAPAGQRATILSLRAAAQLAQRDLDAAAASSAAAEEAAPGDRDVLLTAARVALDRRDSAGASARADRILAAEPGQPDAMLIRSEVALRANDAKAALVDAQAALSAAPKRLDARLSKARALTALGQDTEARSTIEEVLLSAPRYPAANYLRLILALRHADYPAADASLAVLSPVLGVLPRGLYYMAVTKLGVGQPAQAEEAATKFLAQVPDDPAGLRVMAFIDITRQKPAAAVQLLRPIVLSGHADADTLDVYGRAQAMSGDLQGAAKTFTQATGKAPTDAALLNRLAAVKMTLGQASEAEADLRHSLALLPAQPQTGEALVQSSLARGDTQAARASVDQLRKSAGDTEAVGVLDAQVGIATYDLDGAQAKLLALKKRFPDSRPVLLNLVQIASLRGDQQAGQDLLEDWLRRHPDDETALGLLLPTLFAGNHADRAIAVAEAAHQAAASNPRITASLATAYVRTGATPRALALLDRARAEDNLDLALLRAQILTTAGRGRKAADAYGEVLRHAPSNIVARRNLASLQIGARDFDGARKTLADGLRLAPGSFQMMGALVGLELQTGGIQPALATAATLQQDPRNMPGAASLPGDAWLAARDPAHAAEAYQAALDKTPSGELAGRAASALVAAGRKDEATALLTRWIGAHPDDLAVQSLLADQDLSAHRLDQASSRLRAVLAARPGDTAALNNLAWVLLQQGDLKGAADFGKRAYVRAPTPAVADTLGWILAKQNDTAHAIPLLAQGSASTAPDQGARRYHYAYALNAAGRGAEARTQLEQALADPASFEGRDDARHLLETLPR